MQKAKIAIGIAISLIFVYILSRGINFSELSNAFDNIHYWIIVPFILVQLFSYWIRSLRWKAILSSVKVIKTKELFPVITISYMANNILPLRLGELVRAFLVGKKGGISSTSAFSTILLERIYDGITLLLFLGVSAFLFPFPMWVKQIALLTSLLFIGALLFSIGIVAFKQKTLNFIELCMKIVPQKIRGKLFEILNRLVEGFEVIKNRKVLLPIIGYSILIWTMEASLFYAVAEAFDMKQSIYIALFVLVIVNLGIMIPSSPGYIGTFEFFIIKSLGVFGISEELALGYAVVLRVAQYVPITLLGFYHMLKEGLSLKKITRISEKNMEEE